MLAARMEHGQDHQVRIAEQPLFGLRTRRFGRAHQLPEMAVAGQSADVLQADPSQANDFIFREDFLARLDSDHRSAPSSGLATTLRAGTFPCNSRSVLVGVGLSGTISAKMLHMTGRTAWIRAVFTRIISQVPVFAGKVTKFGWHTFAD